MGRKNDGYVGVVEFRYLVVAILAWLWWSIHLLAYRSMRGGEGGEPRYIRCVWWIGVVMLPVIGGIALSNPTGLLSTFTALMFVGMLGLWGLTGLVVWVQLVRGSCCTVKETVVV